VERLVGLAGLDPAPFATVPASPGSPGLILRRSPPAGIKGLPADRGTGITPAAAAGALRPSPAAGK
jgi:hypothetical protein